MAKHQNLMGQRFGRLVAVRKVFAPRQEIIYLCYCDCGSSKNIRASHLRNGNTQSCGCYYREVIQTSSLTHGMTYVREYPVWTAMIQRCINPKDKRYKNYGGRGIKVCDRWRSSFEDFIADMGRCPPKHSLDRIDNDGDYSPENCRWADVKQQARNRSNNLFLECGGKRQCLAAWAVETGIDRRAIVNRIQRGWSVEKALTTPLEVQKHPRRLPKRGCEVV